MLDVFHIGYHKTGTTWLQNVVFPGVTTRQYVPIDPHRPGGWLDFIDEDGDSIVTRMATEVRTSAGEAGLWSYEAMSGRVFRGSRHRFRTADRLHRVLRDPGIVVVVRAQPSMLVSLYGQYVNQGGTDSFQSVLAGTATSLDLDFEHFDYDGLIGHYQGLFGRDRVLVLTFEDLQHSADAFLAKLGSFLGSDLPVEDVNRRNTSGTAWAVHALRRWNRLFRQSTFNPTPLLELRGTGTVRRLVQQTRWGKTLSDQYEPAAREFSARYADSNTSLSERIGRDLAALGYPCS